MSDEAATALADGALSAVILMSARSARLFREQLRFHGTGGADRRSHPHCRQQGHCRGSGAGLAGKLRCAPPDARTAFSHCLFVLSSCGGTASGHRRGRRKGPDHGMTAKTPKDEDPDIIEGVAVEKTASSGRRGRAVRKAGSAPPETDAPDTGNDAADAAGRPPRCAEGCWPAVTGGGLPVMISGAALLLAAGRGRLPDLAVRKKRDGAAGRDRGHGGPP